MDFNINMRKELFNIALNSAELCADLVKLFNELESSEVGKFQELNQDALSRYLTVCKKRQLEAYLHHLKAAEICHSFLVNERKDNVPIGLIFDHHAETLYIYSTAAGNEMQISNSKLLRKYKSIFIAIPGEINISNVLALCLVINTWLTRMLFQNQFVWHTTLSTIANHPAVTERNALGFLRPFRETGNKKSQHIHTESEKTFIKVLLNGLVKNEVDYETVLLKLSKRYHPRPMKESEKTFVKKKFLKYNRRILASELQILLQNVNDVQSTVQLSEWLGMKADPPDVVKSMKSYQRYQDCKKIMTPTECESFMKETAKSCTDALQAKVNTLAKDQVLPSDDSEKQILHVVEAITNLGIGIVKASSKNARKFLKHSGSSVVSAAKQITHEALLLEKLIQTKKLDMYQDQPISVHSLPIIKSLETDKSIRCHLEQQQSYEKLDESFFNTILDQLMGEYLAKEKLCKRKGKGMLNILEQLRCNWLIEFGSILKCIEGMHYKAHNSGIIFIKMRLVHINFDIVRNLIDMDNSDLMRQYISKHLTNFIKFLKKFTNAEQNLIEDESNEDSDDNNARDSPMQERDIGEREVDSGDGTSNGAEDEFKEESSNTHLEAGSIRFEDFHEEWKRKAACESILKKFKSRLGEKSDINLPESMIQSIELMQYMNFDEGEILIKVLTTKILQEGVDMPYDVLQWILNMVLYQNESMWVKVFTWIFGLNPLKCWPYEFLVQYLIYNGIIAVADEKEFRDVFQEVHDSRWFPAIFQLCSRTDDVSILFSVAEFMKSISYDDSLLHYLLESDCSRWKDILEANRIWKVLSDLPVEWSEHRFIEATTYLDQLQQVHGKEVVSELIELLKNIEKSPEDIILKILRHFFTGYWPLTTNILKNLGGTAIRNWEEVLDNACFPKEDRSLDHLIELILKDRNNSDRFRESNGKSSESELWKRLLNSTVNEGKVIDTFGNKFSRDWETNFKEKILPLSDEEKSFYMQKFSNWSKAFKSRAACAPEGDKGKFLLDNIKEFFAHIEIGISLVTKYKLRQVQRLSLLIMLLSKDRAVLQQVATGEGKTIIIVAFAIAKALLGHSVDIITSSSVLAERDATDKDNVAIYNLFGITVSHNSFQNQDQRINAYKCDVVYGEIGSFQHDLLMQQFYLTQIIGERKADVLVVDEADSMLLDNAEHVLYLSHDIHDLEALEPVFVHIWNFVHSKGVFGTPDDIKMIEDAILNAIYGSIKRGDLTESLVCLGDSAQDATNLLWNKMISKRVIDGKGRILMKKELIANAISLDLGKTELYERKGVKNKELEGLALGFLKDVLRRGTYIIVPNHLEGFIALHLSTWIKNAFKAKVMQEKSHYIVNADVTKEGGKDKKIIIMDTDTGKENFNMIWSDGLHQFLQLKHGCKCTAISLKAVFSSNVQFFNLYNGSVYGLTGTLGSLREREVLQEMFNVDYVNVPTFRPKRFSQDEDRIFSIQEDWLEELTKISMEIARERPVLVICETIDALETVERKLNGKSMDLFVYKHSYEPIDIVKENKQIEKGCIILATNLAGRGTDIKVSEMMETKGGLHVILTYLPRNIRVQEQAFGRTARKGQRGSGQLFICAGKLFEDEERAVVRLSLLIKKRNNEERERLNSIKDHYEKRIKKEESYFMKFKDTFSEMLEATKDLDPGLREIIKLSCIDKWALWLDALDTLIDSSPEHQEKSWDSFHNIIVGQSKRIISFEPSGSILPLLSVLFGTPFSIDPMLEIVCGVSRRISLGLYLLEKEYYNKAEEVFKRVICEEPNFSEAAHYYQIFALVKETNLAEDHDKVRANMHLFNAKDIISGRIEMYSQIIAIAKGINSLHSHGNNSFSTVDHYHEQKENLINLLSCFSSSIDDMIGYDIDHTILDSITENLNLSRSLEKSNLLTESRLFRFDGDGPSAVKQEYDQFMSSKLEELKKRYSMYCQEIKKKIAELQAANKPLSKEDFENVLPSREEFWSLLQQNKCIINVQCYTIIDIKKLSSSKTVSDTFCHVLNSIKKNNSNNDFEQFKEHSIEVTDVSKRKYFPSKGERNMKRPVICLNPEDIKDICDNTKIAIKDENEGLINKRLSLDLRARNIISTNKIGTLQPENATHPITKYDLFVLEDLLEIPGINKDIASDIYKRLNIDTSKSTADLVNFELKNHKIFEIDVKNLIRKKLQYREYLEKTFYDCMIPFEELGFQTHEILWQDLLDLRIMVPKRIQPSMKEEELEKSLISTLSNMHDKSVPKEAKKISSELIKLASSISRYSTVDATMKDFVEILDDKVKSKAASEIDILLSAGLTKVVILEKKKSWWSTFWKILGIIALGIAQICVGVLIEVFTVGAGTFVAEGFIGEGVGDLMFAAECIVSWHCSMKEYLDQKLMSLAITVLTCGIGAWFARGAKFSRFGSKIAKEFEHIAGKELLEKAGTRRVVKEAAKRVGKKVAEATAIGFANEAVNKLVENMLRDFLKGICSKIISGFKELGGFELRSAIKEMYRKAGEETILIGLDICDTCLSDKNADMKDKAIRIFNDISQKFGNAVEKLKSSKASGAKLAVLEEAAKVIGELSQAIPYLRAIDDMTSTVEKFKNELPKKIMDKTELLANKNCNVKDKKVDLILKKMGDHLAERIEEILEQEIVQPLLQQKVATIVHHAGKQVKQTYREIQTHFQWKKMRDILSAPEQAMPPAHDASEDHVGYKEKVEDERITALTQLLRKVRDPKLYAEILEKHNVPMGIHEAQAISNAFGREIVIIQYGKDGHTLIQASYKPSSEAGSHNPIKLYFKPSKNGGTGHFSASQESITKRESSGKNNCLLDAVNEITGEHLTRARVVSVIKSSPEICEDILKGFHKHYIDVGGIGGAIRTRKRAENFRVFLGKLKQRAQEEIEHGKEFKLTDDEKRKLLDPARPIFKFMTPNMPEILTEKLTEIAKQSCKKNPRKLNCGNHELVPREFMAVLLENDVKQRGYHHENNNLLIQWSHLCTEFRVDIRYCVFLFNNTLQGHPNALYSHDSLSPGSQKTKGSSKALHDEVGKKALASCERPLECAINILERHLDAIASRDELMRSYNNGNMELFNDCYSITGLDLSKEGDREKYFAGLERERSKFKLCIEKLKNPNRMFEKGSEDTAYDKLIKDKLNTCKKVEDLGAILREPAPFGVRS